MRQGIETNRRTTQDLWLWLCATGEGSQLSLQEAGLLARPGPGGTRCRGFSGCQEEEPKMNTNTVEKPVT